MYLLRDCSICLEGFDTERNPCSISCGHVFCRPCLNSHLEDNRSLTCPLCPLCRAPIPSGSVRNIICEFQSPAAMSTPESPPMESVLWKLIRNVVGKHDSRRQRGYLAQHYTAEGMRELGVSENLLAAFGAVKMLAEVERVNDELKRELEQSRTVEAGLRDRTTALEREVETSKSRTSTDKQEAQSLRFKLQMLQATFEIIHDLTSSSQSPAPSPSPTSNQPRPCIQTNAETEYVRIMPDPESSPDDPQPQFLRFGHDVASTRTPAPESPSLVRARPHTLIASGPSSATPSPRSFFNLNPGGQRPSNPSTIAPPLLSPPDSPGFRFGARH